MATIFNEIFFRPLFNTLVVLYEHVTYGDMGLAIILLTILIRLALYPVFWKTFKHQAELEKLRPDMQRLQEKHKGDRTAHAQAVLALHKERGVNPYSSFLLLLIQLPILIALFNVFRKGFTAETLVHLYPFVSPPLEIANDFLGLLDLGGRHILVVALAAGAQYLQARVSMPKQEPGMQENPTVRMARQMTVVTPLITAISFITLPAAVGFYWITSALFSTVQHLIMRRSLAKKKPTTNHAPQPQRASNDDTQPRRLQ